MTKKERLVVMEIETLVHGLSDSAALTALIYCVVHRCATAGDRRKCAELIETADTALLRGGSLALKAFGQ